MRLKIASPASYPSTEARRQRIMSHFSATPLFEKLSFAPATTGTGSFALANGYRFPSFYQQPQIQHNDFVTLKTKMADDKPLLIPIDSIERDFEDFLSPASNTRIIFSGPFGIGKTYFLDKFFKNKNKKYLPIFLRPVNYSLLSNEDIFRLIKYDILFQIIKDRQFIFDDIPDFTKMEFTQFFASQNLFLPLVNLLKTLPKIKTLVTGVEEIEKLITKYSEGLRQINKNEKLSVLSEFRTEAETNFLLEYDQVSQLIADQLDEIAEKDGLQKVLIIDDLDRLDPEHIFRLFNVFSAHFDHVNYYSDGEDVKDNKFGFDKIMFVCDIENIRKIFTHKYGDGVDFMGYIDKFYSTRPYHFLNYSSINIYIKRDLKLENIPTEANFFIQTIGLFLMQNKLINLRKIENLHKIHQKHEALNESELYMIKEISFTYDLIDWIRHLSPLKSLYGSYSHLIEIIANSSNYSQSSIDYSDLERYFKQAIMVYALHRSIRKNNQQGPLKSIKIDYSSFIADIEYRENIDNDLVLLRKYNVNLNKKDSITIKFSDFKEVMISVLTVGLSFGILNE